MQIDEQNQNKMGLDKRCSSGAVLVKHPINFIKILAASGN